MPALHRDGHEFPVELTISHIQLGDNYMFATFLHDITARRRLERELVEISEREQQRFGQELHDTVAQTLTGVAMMSVGLRHHLEKSSPTIVELATRIEECANLAASQAHDLARSLFPLELQRAGLATALRELAGTVTTLYGIQCRFTNTAPDCAGSGHKRRETQPRHAN
jgi:signal transduction histidine kinase